MKSLQVSPLMSNLRQAECPSESSQTSMLVQSQVRIKAAVVSLPTKTDTHDRNVTCFLCHLSLLIPLLFGIFMPSYMASDSHCTKLCPPSIF